MPDKRSSASENNLLDPEILIATITEKITVKLLEFTDNEFDSEVFESLISTVGEGISEAADKISHDSLTGSSASTHKLKTQGIAVGIAAVGTVLQATKLPVSGIQK